RVERRSVRLADRDPRLLPSRLDPLHAPRGRWRADVDRLAVVVEPDLRGLPELARLPLALDVDVLALPEHTVEVRRERRPGGGDEREMNDDSGESTHRTPSLRWPTLLPAIAGAQAGEVGLSR